MARRSGLLKLTIPALAAVLVITLWYSDLPWSFVPSELPQLAVPAAVRDAGPPDARWLSLTRCNGWLLAVSRPETNRLQVLLFRDETGTGSPAAAVDWEETVAFEPAEVFRVHLSLAVVPDQEEAETFEVAWGWVLDKRAATVRGFTSSGSTQSARISNGFWVLVKVHGDGQAWEMFQALSGRFSILRVRRLDGPT